MTCRGVATLIASGQLDAAPWPRRLSVRLHIAMYRHCRRFRRQLQQLEVGMRRALADLDADPSADLEDGS